MQTHDVVINGQGYMLQPGSYRYECGGAEVRRFRTGVPAFDQRLGRAATLPQSADKDASRWAAVGMVPVPVGLGDEPGRLMLGPKELTVALGAAFDASACCCIYNGVFYLSLLGNLYKITTSGGAYSALTFIGAVASGSVTSMCVSNGLLTMATSGTAMANYAGSGAIANTPAVAAGICWDFARGLWRSKKDGTTGEWSIASGSFDGGSTWTDFHLDSAIKCAVVRRGRATGGGVCLVCTAGMIWELSGKWSGSPATFSGTVNAIFDGRGGGGLDDFAWAVAHEGYVYTWYAGTVQRWNGTRLEPMDGAPRGRVQGMGTAGGWLCVSVWDAASSLFLVHAYDGVRWFVLARSATPYGTLGGTAGLVSDGHLFSLNQTTSFSRWELPVTAFQTAANTAASGQVLGGPFDAGTGDSVKTWTAVSVPWSTALLPAGTTSPANPGGNLLAEYSVDDGVNFVSLGTVAVANGARSGVAMWTMPNQGVQASRLLVRITWTPAAAYAALQLDGLFTTGWQVAPTPHHERWELAVRCSDKMIRRDQSVDSRSGETMLLALRALARSGGTFAVQDMDYDVNARTITARIADLKETERKGNGTHFLESTVHLVLEAVA